AGATFGKGRTSFEKIRDEQILEGEEILGPFRDDDEWQLARWLMKHVGHNAADEFLRMNMIRTRAQPSFTTKKEYLDKIDELPGGVGWTVEEVVLLGDKVDIEGKKMEERLEVWYRDPVECIKELVGNPMFRDVMKYAPERQFEDASKTSEVINEMWTGSWWWDLQKLLPAGATVAPVILSSDKTKLSQFRGDKSAWPVYLTIGNIAKEVRRNVSSHATVLIGYIPVGKFDCYTDSAKQFARYRAFHSCMEIITETLAKAGETGVPMTCSDGFIRAVYPIYAAYVADYPEQCLIACCKENCCPFCTVKPTERGENVPFPPRVQAETLEILSELAMKMASDEMKAKAEAIGLRQVFNPFWRHLPHSSIFQSFTPDLLHQLHKGVFKDHLMGWCQELIGKLELDERFKSMSSHPGLRHFKEGISNVSQWTGAEHKAMEQVFVGLIAGAVDKRVLMAVKSAVDFIFFASLQSHTSESLARLQQALDDFHEYKDVFIEKEIRDHFNIPKIHSMQHYVALIRLFGSADGFNTESPERLHIDYAKDAYRASNKKDYTIQMTVWLSRQEAVDRFVAFLNWCRNGSYHPVGSADTPHSDPKEAGDIEKDTPLSTVVASVAASSSAPSTSIHVASTHPRDLTRIRASDIIENHNATRFLDALSVFIASHGGLIPPQYFDTFNLYRRLTIMLPHIPQTGSELRNLKNIVRAGPPVPAAGRRSAEPAHLDFALVRTGERNERTRGTALEGLRVAHVRVLFELPAVYCLDVSLDRPLAYIEWLTPFATPDATSGLYSLTRSSRNRGPYGEIIYADRIVRNCHMQPKYGKTKPLAWTTENVSDK
ncbi:hypothetical protein BDZ89DRAFT_903167, partial [Hymenopellis radicata]